jgi:hypothetical protein
LVDAPPLEPLEPLVEGGGVCDAAVSLDELLELDLLSLPQPPTARARSAAKTAADERFSFMESSVDRVPW